MKGNGERLPREGSEEFAWKRDAILRTVTTKYAWTAQQSGMVLRANPMKQQAMRDYEFDRLAAAHYSFRYVTSSGRTKRWFPKVEQLLAALDDPDADCGLIIAERLDFLPGQPEITEDEDGAIILNLWREPKWQLLNDVVTPSLFLDHLRYVLDGDGTATEHVVNYIAHLLQKPTERVGHALLITSEAKGIGKSTIGTVIRHLVGERNARVAQTKDLKSQFDGWLVGKLFVQIDEVYEAGNWDLANKLKPLITEPTVSVNVKYGPQMEIMNFARLMMFSNHTAPLNIEAGDRRYFVFNSDAQPRDDDYYEDLYRYLGNDHTMNELYTYFMRHDISAFNPFRRPPMTEAKAQIIEDSGNPLAVYVTNAVANRHFLSELGREFGFDDLARQLQKDGYGAHAKNTKELGTALEAAGVLKKRITVNGLRVRRYVLPPLDGDEEWEAQQRPSF